MLPWGFKVISDLRWRALRSCNPHFLVNKSYKPLNSDWRMVLNLYWNSEWSPVACLIAPRKPED